RWHRDGPPRRRNTRRRNIRVTGPASPRRGVLSRRAVLAGGAGLVVGAGAVEMANVLTPGSSAAPKVELPGEDLMAEHGVLKRVLLVYQAAVTRLNAGQQTPAQAIHEGAQ